MYITILGILTDQSGKVLLRRVDPTLPGLVDCSLESGVLPGQTLARAFREKTGLIVQPVRLTGLYWKAERNSGRMTLVYRCIMRGGEVTQIDDQPSAGFFDPRSLPSGLSEESRRMLADALRHGGGAPILARLTAGSGRRLRQLFKTPPAADNPPTEWPADVRLVITAEDGRIAWVRRSTNELWTLPAAAVPSGQAPWETAGLLARKLWPDRDLPESFTPVLIQLAKNKPALTFVFLAITARPLISPAETETIAFISPEAAGDGFVSADMILAKNWQAAGDLLVVEVES